MTTGKNLLYFYKFINILSIDIALGAVSGAAFFAYILDVSLLPQAFLALGITVWIIYAADHLLDVWKSKTEVATERHRFHQNNARSLVWCVGIAMLADAILIVYIRKNVLVWGVALSSIVIIYFLVHRYLKIWRELFAAFLYCAGILMPALAQSSTAPSMVQVVLMGQFFLVVLINMLLFSWFDRHIDLRERYFSFVTMAGEASTTYVMISLMALNLVGTVYLAVQSWGMIAPSLLIIAMTVILLMIFLFRKYFQVNDRYRLLGDAVFFLPALYLLFSP